MRRPICGRCGKPLCKTMDNAFTPGFPPIDYFGYCRNGECYLGLAERIIDINGQNSNGLHEEDFTMFDKLNGLEMEEILNNPVSVQSVIDDIERKRIEMEEILNNIDTEANVAGILIATESGE